MSFKVLKSIKFNKKYESETCNKVEIVEHCVQKYLDKTLRTQDLGLVLSLSKEEIAIEDYAHISSTTEFKILDHIIRGRS